MNPEREDQPARPNVDGITEEDWGSWRRHPAARLFRKYIRDRVREWTDDAINTIASQAMTVEQQAEFRMKLRMALEFADMPFQQVLGFYEQNPEFRPISYEDEK